MIERQFVFSPIWNNPGMKYGHKSTQWGKSNCFVRVIQLEWPESVRILSSNRSQIDYLIEYRRVIACGHYTATVLDEDNDADRQTVIRADPEKVLSMQSNT